MILGEILWYINVITSTQITHHGSNGDFMVMESQDSVNFQGATYTSYKAQLLFITFGKISVSKTTAVA